MRNKQDLLHELELVQSMKFISQAYQEISVMRMQKIRSAVLRTREFLESLSEVFYDVKRSYNEYIKVMVAKNKAEDVSLLTLLPKNGKSVAVLISSKEKMLGGITQKVFASFMKAAQVENTDIIIIGKAGRDLYKQSGIKKPIIFLEVADDIIHYDDIKRISFYVVNYSKINVFYGKFESLLTQSPVQSNLSGDNPFIETIATDEETSNTSTTQFLFEPSIEKIMQFFETQVFTSLFKQTFHESQLARHASRINAMEEALINIEKTNKELAQQKKQLRKMTMNRQQLESISGMSVWNH